MSNRIVRLTYSRTLDSYMFVGKYTDLLNKCPGGTKILSSGVDMQSNRNYLVLENDDFMEVPEGGLATEVHAVGVENGHTFEWHVDFSGVMEQAWQGFDLTTIHNNQYTFNLPEGLEFSDELKESMGSFHKKIKCTHSWKNYLGLSQTYKYCEHCGEKQ